MRLAFRSGNYIYKCQIKVSVARVVEKIKFRETALICKILKCERISEVKSTFYHLLVSIVVVVLFLS